MANETTAWGTVTINAPTKDALEDFIYLKILSEKNTTYKTKFSDFPQYTIHTEGEFSKEQVIKVLHDKYDTYKEPDGTYSVNLALCGVGRWTFGQNAHWFFSRPLNGFEYETYEQNKLRDNLKKLTFKAEFDVEEETDSFYSHDTYKVFWDWWFRFYDTFQETNIAYKQVG